VAVRGKRAAGPETSNLRVSGPGPTEIGGATAFD
jgi:hypothetical protein